MTNTLKYTWFPNEDHLSKKDYSQLTWAGAGKNDFIEVIKDDQNIPRIPLSKEGEPALRIHFKHTKNELKSEESWWSVVVGFALGAHPPEWQPQDLSNCSSIKVYARAYFDPMNKDKPLSAPIPLYMRFEDDHILSHKPLHPSSSWCKNPMYVTEWLRPEEIQLSDFAWGENAFWSQSPAVDIQKILQITFGMDTAMPSCEGYIEIQRIEFFAISKE